MADLQLFKTFLAVLETSTYSAAAQKLDYTQPTVTKHIQLLEADYGGMKLLRRQGNRMVPTEQGQVLQTYAAQLLRLYEESFQALSSAGLQTLRLGATYALSERGLPAAIQCIRAFAPDTLLHLTNGNPEVLYALLKSGQLDIIFVIDYPRSYRGFSVKTIRREEIAVLVPPQHPLAARSGASFEDIQDERLILTEEGCRFRQFLLDLFAARQRTPKIVMELDSIPAIRHAASQRQGIGFLPAILAKGDDGLTAVPFTGGRRNLYSQAIYRPSGFCSEALVAHAAEAIRSSFAQI